MRELGSAAWPNFQLALGKRFGLQPKEMYLTAPKSPLFGDVQDCAESVEPGYGAVLITDTPITKTYDPPLTTDPHGPLNRFDKAVRLAQQPLDAAIDAKRHHTSQNLAHEVIKEARDALRRAEKARALKLMELGASAKSDSGGERGPPGAGKSE